MAGRSCGRLRSRRNCGTVQRPSNAVKSARDPRETAMPAASSAEPRAYPRPLPNPEWLGKLNEEIVEPGLPIVDPHHHLWDHPGSRYLLDELLADVNSGHNIVATVFIQCGSGYRTSGPEEMRPIGESEFVRAGREDEARTARSRALRALRQPIAAVFARRRAARRVRRQ
jgi:hypothetical protein